MLEILVLLKFQCQRLRAKFGVYFMLEAYIDLKFVLRGKNASKFIRERRNQNSKSAKIFMRKVIALQHWVAEI